MGKGVKMPSAMEQEREMDFQEFLIAISKFGWGLASSNTYWIKKEDWKGGQEEPRQEEYIFIQISEKGDKGEFEKREFKVCDLNQGLQKWFGELVWRVHIVEVR